MRFNVDSFKAMFTGAKNQGTQKSRRRVSSPSVESLEGRKLLTLSPVSTSAGGIFNTIVEIRETFPNRDVRVGSGVLIDSFHVLTAGHVVYDGSRGGWPTSITVTPDLNGTSAPYGTAQATYERTYTNWVNYSNAHADLTATNASDIGLITLNHKIGTYTGTSSFGYDNNNADFARGAILNTAGYPAAPYDGTHMEFSAGAINGLSSDGLAITYSDPSITVYGGQSGSPVWRYTASTGTRVIYGVVDSATFAARITQSVFNDLQNWRNSDKPPTY